MNRNTQTIFANTATVKAQRSTFNRDSKYLTTCNVGQLIPFYLDEVLPGDEMSIKTNKLVRLQTLITPLFDDLFLDTFWFYVPNRLLWEHWKEFQGENESAWTLNTQYSVPQITPPPAVGSTVRGWNTGTLADYFGLPVNNASRPILSNVSYSALPFRAYTKIVNDWFIDKNLQDEAYFSTGDANVQGSNGSNYLTDLALGGKPFVANKYHDYFTSCLPQPQRQVGTMDAHGVYAAIDMGVSPVVSVGNAYRVVAGEPNPQNWYRANTIAAANENAMVYELHGGTQYPSQPTSHSMATNPSARLTQINDTPTLISNSQLAPHNLYAQINYNPATNTAEGGKLYIQDLRFAYQYQKYLEALARGGTRYVEQIKSLFGVTCPDFRVQRSEYLGGNRIKLNVSQVVQTSSTDSTSPQGTLAAYSATGDSHGDFHKSFTEHGLLIGLACVRYHHSYQQNTQRYWFKQDTLDFYVPQFANISEQPVYTREIFENPQTFDTVFGYQEAWADYRYKPNSVTGEFRSYSQTPLDMWHLADKYATAPTLSSSWLQEDASNLDRALAIQSSVSNQVLMDFYVENKSTRCMPVHSIPGLSDHH